MKASTEMRAKYGKAIHDLCKMVDGDLVTSLEGDSNNDGGTAFHEVFANVSLDVMRQAVVVNFPKESCGHTHDCCGCMFRSSTRVVSAYDRPGVSYFIVDSWGRNI